MTKKDKNKLPVEVNWMPLIIGAVCLLIGISVAYFIIRPQLIQ